MPKFAIELDERQFCAVLAALRAYQNVQQHEPLDPSIVAIATNDGQYELPTHDEVDQLAEYLNE